MILTGKCKEDFIEWKRNNKQLSTIEVLDFKHLSNISKYALIIEFFSSKGYYFNRGLSFVKSKPYKCELYTLYNDKILGECYEFISKYLNITELKATTEAIKKANEFYNKKLNIL